MEAIERYKAYEKIAVFSTLLNYSSSSSPCSTTFVLGPLTIFPIRIAWN
jgi:hypothetical protein